MLGHRELSPRTLQILEEVAARTERAKEVTIVRATSVEDKLADEARIEEVRELTLDDRIELDIAGTTSSDTKAAAKHISEIKPRHREIARLMVLGYRDMHIAAVLGMASTTVSHLRRQPVFVELLRELQAQRDNAVMNLDTHIELAAETGVQILAKRLEDEGDVMPIEHVRKVTQMLLDRSGHAPVTRTENKNLNLTMSKEELEKAKALGRQLRVLPQGGGDAIPAELNVQPAHVEPSESLTPRGDESLGQDL